MNLVTVTVMLPEIKRIDYMDPSGNHFASVTWKDGKAARVGKVIPKPYTAILHYFDGTITSVEQLEGDKYKVNWKIEPSQLG